MQETSDGTRNTRCNIHTWCLTRRIFDNFVDRDDLTWTTSNKGNATSRCGSASEMITSSCVSESTETVQWERFRNDHVQLRVRVNGDSPVFWRWHTCGNYVVWGSKRVRTTHEVWSSTSVNGESDPSIHTPNKDADKRWRKIRSLVQRADK